MEILCTFCKLCLILIQCHTIVEILKQYINKCLMKMGTIVISHFDIQVWFAEIR